MRCPFCSHDDTRVIDSRVAEDGSSIRRRRECPACASRFSTVEQAELRLPLVVKNDGSREPFDIEKLRTGFERALRKRPVDALRVEAAVQAVLTELRLSGERELPSRRIGEWVMQQLKPLDPVAYVRFASVYRSFEDVRDFREEIEKLERDLPAEQNLELPLGEPGPGAPRPAGRGQRSGR